MTGNYDHIVLNCINLKPSHCVNNGGKLTPLCKMVGKLFHQKKGGKFNSFYCCLALYKNMAGN